MINYDEARREIWSEMDDWQDLAYNDNDPIAIKEMERLNACLNQLYIDAEKDHWEWEIID